MKFLLDVHIAAAIGRVLADKGHDVVSASAAHADWTDARLLQLAVDEDRVIVTEDRDFSNLIYRDDAAMPPAVLYLRCGPAEQLAMVERVLLVVANTTIHGHMVVIRRSSIRHRRLPQKSIDNG